MEREPRERKRLVDKRKITINEQMVFLQAEAKYLVFYNQTNLTSHQAQSYKLCRFSFGVLDRSIT